MRPLELALLASELLALVTLAGRGARLGGALSLLSISLAAAQIGLEGARWQMLPGYGLAAALVGMSLWRMMHQASSATWQRAAGVGALAIWAAIACALPWFLPVFSFPPPDGPFGIGTETFHWIDVDRVELFASNPAARRELMVQIWYPASPAPGAATDAYVHGVDFSRVTSGVAHLPPFLLDHLSLVQTHAVPSAPVATGGGAFPVLLFSPGRGGFRANNTYQIESLVSHGFVVAGIDHPYTVADTVFPDGRHVLLDSRVMAFKSDGSDGPFALAVDDQLGEDALFVLDRLAGIAAATSADGLAGRLDLAHVGIWGSSLGGRTAAEACRMDGRFRACLALDVNMPEDVVATPLLQPMMWIVRAATADQRKDEGWPPGAAELERTSIAQTFGKLGGDGYVVSIEGMYHSDIGDLPYYFSQPVAGWLRLTGPADWRQTQRTINAYSLAFFDRYLRGVDSPLLAGGESPLPGVTVVAR